MRGVHGFDLAPFDPVRFAVAGAAWHNPFTAGELSRVVGASALASPP